MSIIVSIVVIICITVSSVIMCENVTDTNVVQGVSSIVSQIVSAPLTALSAGFTAEDFRNTILTNIQTGVTNNIIHIGENGITSDSLETGIQDGSHVSYHSLTKVFKKLVLSV